MAGAKVAVGRDNEHVADLRQGDAVHVEGFGKGIVREVRNRGRYLVEVKGRAMEVIASQLSPITEKPASRPARSLVPDASPNTPEGRGASVTLDLHGHTVDEAVEALDICLNDAILAGASEIRVIHGRSGGRVKMAVHRRLHSFPSVRSFRLDPRNPGVTVVAL
jgi:DNA mismatch repair protein MutS2